MFPEFSTAAIAVATLLSSIVRQLRSGSIWYAIDLGQATSEHLRELTGIKDYDRLQEAFGAPRMDGIWPVTRATVKAQRTGLGYLLGDKWLDGGSCLVALVCLMPIWPMWSSGTIFQILLAFAGIYQLCGWLASTVLLGKGGARPPPRGPTIH